MPFASAGAVELLQTGRLPADHWDWAMGAGFSFTPDEDGSSAGEDQPKDPPMPAGAPAASSADGGGGGENQPNDLPTPAAITATATAGAAAHGTVVGEQGRPAGPANGIGSGDGGGTAGAPAAAAGSDAAANGGEEAGSAGDPGPVHGVDLEHSFCLASADGLATAFTNYVRGCATEPRITTQLRQAACCQSVATFVQGTPLSRSGAQPVAAARRYAGLLDYVWHEPARLAARRVLPQPLAADLAGWLPSERHPSDHLAVVADLEWLPGGPGADAPAARLTAEPAEPSVPGGAPWAASGAGSLVGNWGVDAGLAGPLGGPMPQRRRPLRHALAAAGSHAACDGAAARGLGASSDADPGLDAVHAGSAESAQGGADPAPASLGGPPSWASAEASRAATAAEAPVAAERLQGSAGAAPHSPGALRPLLAKVEARGVAAAAERSGGTEGPDGGGGGAPGGSGAPSVLTPATAPGAAAAAAAALASGGVVAVPTDTLYGLACDASRAAAVAAIYAIKVGYYKP